MVFRNPPGSPTGLEAARPAAVSWIVAERPEIRHFYLESNFATDKKASLVNVMQTRGKRVTHRESTSVERNDS